MKSAEERDEGYMSLKMKLYEKNRLKTQFKFGSIAET